MDELYLNDLLRFSREEMERVKVRFNLQPKGGQDPMELYLENREKVNTEWLLAKKKKGFFQEGEIAIALVRLDDQGRWLLTTIKRITKALDVVSETGAIAYEASELEQYAPYFGRTVVRYHKTGQAPLWRYKKIHEKLVVDEILPAVYTGEGFPGYDQVRLSWQKLKRIAEQMEEKYPFLTVHVHSIRNDFFGERITVSGLVTAQDIIAQLKGKELGSRLLIPCSMLKADEDVFLDDYTVKQVSDALQVPVDIVKSSGQNLIDAILGC